MSERDKYLTEAEQHTLRDRFLTESLGECWHDYRYTYDVAQDKAFVCSKCKDIQLIKFTKAYPKTQTNFSTWDGFGLLWTWVQGQEWLDDFASKNYGKVMCDCGCHDIEWNCYIIHPDRFANEIYEFLKERQLRLEREK